MTKLTLALIISLSISVESLAQIDDKSEDNYPPVVIKNSESHSLSSAYIDQEYQIYIHLPSNYKSSDTTYPVLYLVDTDIAFGFTADANRILAIAGEAPELIIVGISYGAYYGQKGNNRRRDYSPTEDPDYPNSGGAKKFLSFIQYELIPFVESNYSVNPSDRTISGASIGGLFALYVLFHQPGVFNRYIIGSPSLWWDSGVIFEYEKKYSEERSDLNAILFLSVGGKEDVEKMVLPWQKLTEVLKQRNYNGLKLTTLKFSETLHSSACLLSLVTGIRAVYSEEK